MKKKYIFTHNSIPIRWAKNKNSIKFYSYNLQFIEINWYISKQSSIFYTDLWKKRELMFAIFSIFSDLLSIYGPFGSEIHYLWWWWWNMILINTQFVFGFFFCSHFVLFRQCDQFSSFMLICFLTFDSTTCFRALTNSFYSFV